MPQIITIGNEKGGVGKTTTVVNLAAAFAALGSRVLVVDMDFQGNATELFGIDRGSVGSKSTAKMILEKDPFDAYRLKSNIEGIDVLAGTPDLKKVIKDLGNTHRQAMLLNSAFKSKTLDEYDLVLIDTHGSGDCLLLSSLAISHHYLVPVFAEPESARGLLDLLKSTREIKEDINPSLKLLGVVITRFDRKNLTHVDFETLIREIGKDAKVRVFENVIPASSSIAAASKQQIPVIQYKGHLPVSQAYVALAGEIKPHLSKSRAGKPSSPDVEKMVGSMEEVERLFG